MSQSKNDNNKFSLKKNKCFKRFFPNLEKEPKFDLKDTKEKNPVFFKLKESHKNPSKTTGCSIMKLSTDVLNPEKFVFESETVIKNENIGIVIWASSKNVRFETDGDSPEFTLRYRLLILEKQNSNEKWSIKWGIAWNDFVESLSWGTTIIKSPDGKIDFEGQTFTNEKGNKDFSDLQSKYYFGIWRETSDNSGNHILKDVLVTSDKDTTPEILGSEGKFSGSGTGYYTVANFYSKDDWKRHDGYEDYTEHLKNWFTPFESKKGWWT